MERFVTVMRFGFPYLWKYRGRFMMGLLLSFVFALTNGGFIALTTLMVQRIESPPPSSTDSAMVEKGASAEETAVKGKPDMGVETFFSGFTKPIGDAIDSMKQGLVDLFDPLLPARGKPLDWLQITGGLLLLPLLSLIRGGFNIASSYCTVWVSVRVIDDIRLDVFRKLQSMSMDFFTKEIQAATLGRVNSDAVTLQGALRLGFQDAVKQPFTLLVILLTLLLLDWQLTIVATIFIPLLAIPIIFISKKVKNKSINSHKVNERMQSALLEGFTNIRITKAFNLSEQQTQEFLGRMLQIRNINMSTFKAKSFLNPIIEAVAAMGVGAIIVFVFATGRGVADLTGFVVGLGMMYTPIKKLAGLPNYFAGTYRPVMRLLELFETEPSVKSKPNAPKIKGFHESLTFENLTFEYEEGRTVVQDFSVDLPRGGRLGLAGHSGSGKSTIVNLIYRFYDTQKGRILIDGKNIQDIDLHSYREQMALVSQDVLLFDATIAENIALGRQGKQLTRQEIEAAAVKAHAHEFIKDLPKGYDTRIGERGQRLSGGQRQRLAIARAFVRDAPILVLDEVTAALDAKAEAIVQEAIDELAEKRTVICIAHRLSTLASMDEILVMEAGRVAERGAFNQLLACDGVFAGMAARQGIRHTPAAV